MSKENILIPVDFSPASESAIRIAQQIAGRNNAHLTLLHISNGKSLSDADEKLKSISDSIFENSKISINTIISEGNLISEITKQASDPGFTMMVIGTHGYKGIREKLMGADILKLLKNIPIPVLVVQKDYQFPADGIKKILVPSSDHESFSFKIEATIQMAKLFDAEVHFYTMEKPGMEISESMKENIRMAKQEFESAGVQYLRVKEKQESFSVGYSKQIMSYANNNNIDVIALITTPTRENYFFADSDKISILTNSDCIPVLCTSDKLMDQD